MKRIYLWFLEQLAKRTTIKKRICYVMSFVDNDSGAIQKLYDIYGNNFSLAYTPEVAQQAQIYANKGIGIVPWQPRTLLISGIRQIASCQVLIVDNYFPELMSLAQDKRKIIQVWHATGAIKAFGWQDPKTKERSAQDQARFQKVYDSMTDIVVGSKKMGQIFQVAYHTAPDKLHYFGALRTDLLQPKPTDESLSLAKNVQLLYVPTYRDSSAEMQQVLSTALDAFENIPEIEVWVKLHPHLAQQFLHLETGDNIHITTDALDKLFDSCNYLVTDYSSCIFDFMLRRPEAAFCLYCPDLLHYQKTTGLQPDFEIEWGTHLTTSPQELQKKIQCSWMQRTIPKASQRDLNQIWNEYNKGHAVAKLLELVDTYL